MTILSAQLGRYAGSGTWRDARGASHAYQVTLTLDARDRALGLAVSHVFDEEPDQPDVNLDLTFFASAPSILAADLGGLSVRGYWDDGAGVLAYAIPIPGNLVETTCLFADGICRIAGSSEKNAAGHFIMWTETLARG